MLKPIWRGRGRNHTRTQDGRLATLTVQLTLRSSVTSTTVLFLRDEPACTGRSPPLRKDVSRSAGRAGLAGSHTVGHRWSAAGGSATCRAGGDQGRGARPGYRPGPPRDLLRVEG